MIRGGGTLAVTLDGNWINVQPGDPEFLLMSNHCDYFEIGEKGGNDIWLEGIIVDGEHIFNGRIYLHDKGMGTIVDTFPKGPTPTGWTKRPRLDSEGYELLDSRGEVVFSYKVNGKSCTVEVNLYSADGTIAAHGGQGGFVAHVPVMIGRGGIRIG